jgi:isopentenyl-diphosphate delta-isomerase
MRTGLECAKALAMGARLVGFAMPLLKPATESSLAVRARLERTAAELKDVMASLGVRNLEELRKVGVSCLD